MCMCMCMRMCVCVYVCVNVTVYVGVVVGDLDIIVFNAYWRSGEFPGSLVHVKPTGDGNDAQFYLRTS